MLGQDASWDLRNYHLYNPFAFLNHRDHLDFFPADIQTYFNPLADFPYAFFALGPLSRFPRVLAALMGLWYGVLVYVTWLLAQLLLSTASRTAPTILVSLCTLTAVTSAMCFAMIGAASNDLAIAVFVLSGLLALLRQPDDKTRIQNCVLGGLLFGGAAGLKLTGGIYAAPLFFAFYFVLPWQEAAKKSAFFTLGWMGGMAATYGWWGLKLWNAFGNPFFPFFNTVFKSPFAPARAVVYQEYFPHNLWQWIVYPFYWAFPSDSRTVYDSAFCDPRMAVSYIALIIGGIVATRRHFLSKQSCNPFTAVQKFTVAFLVMSYLVWLVTCSILRYAVPIEIVSVIAAFIVIFHLMDALGAKRNFLIAAGFTSVICLSCLLMTRYPVWERRDFHDTMYKVDVSWVKPDTMFLGLTPPMAYLSAFVPPEQHAQFVNLLFIKYVEDTPLGEAGKRFVLDHRGPLIVLFAFELDKHLGEAPPPGFALSLPLLSEFGLSPVVKNCKAVISDLASPKTLPMYACEAARL